MKNIWMSNKRYLIIILLIVFSFIFYIEKINRIGEIEKNKLEDNKEYENNSNNTDIYEYAKKYIELNKYNLIKYFKDRVGIIKGNDILIGTNKKELDNGYYDICISLKDSKIDIYILKLWKDNNSKNLYDEYYLKEVSRCVLDMYKKNYTEDEISKIEEYILKSYLESKKDTPIINNCKISNLQILSNVKDGVLVMSIY